MPDDAMMTTLLGPSNVLREPPPPTATTQTANSAEASDTDSRQLRSGRLSHPATLERYVLVHLYVHACF